ncbi:hypothetical protein WDM22_34620 [Bradyrhizobium septentrionale]
MPDKTERPFQKVMSDICLGLTVTSLYTLVGMGMMIAFMPVLR